MQHQERGKHQQHRFVHLLSDAQTQERDVEGDAVVLQQPVHSDSERLPQGWGSLFVEDHKMEA